MEDHNILLCCNLLVDIDVQKGPWMLLLGIKESSDASFFIFFVVV